MRHNSWRGTKYYRFNGQTVAMRKNGVLTIDGETLETTAEHPFYELEWAPWLAVGQTAGRWADALDLQAGDRVWKADGASGVVQSVEVALVQQRMYNLTVAEAHTFFVGEEQWLVHNCGGKFSSGKPPHQATVTVTRDGNTVFEDVFTSGSMTPEEAALGFPRSSLATHTENRAVRQVPLQPGDTMNIAGQYPPCPSCKGAMNKAAKESGASINYVWPDGSWTTRNK